MDLFFDHLLAERWSARHPEPLADYAQRMYALIQSHARYLPDRTRAMLPYMVKGDWLTSYARIEGIGRALAGLARRVPGGEVMVGAEQVLADNLEQYHAEFDAFITDINAHTLPLR
jgi:acyl carrier protein phosphodiesterase